MMKKAVEERDRKLIDMVTQLKKTAGTINSCSQNSNEIFIDEQAYNLFMDEISCILGHFLNISLICLKTSEEINQLKKTFMH